MAEAMQTKRCTKCQRDLPKTTEYFYTDWRQPCRECARKYSRHWGATNREKASAAQRRYLERERELPHRFSKADRQYCLDYWGHRCAICGRIADKERRIAFDHWIPTRREECPGTVIENMLPLCHGIDGCNNSKWSTDPVAWLRHRLGDEAAERKLQEINIYFSKALVRRIISA